MVSRRAGALVALLALVVAGFVGAPFLAGTAYAHASLVRANPANNDTLKRPPSRIILYFSEAIEPDLTQIQVTDDKKTRVDDNQTTFDSKDDTFASVGVKTLDPGLYFVRWSNVSHVDGHNYAGSYPFIVLNSDGTFPAGVSFDNAQSETNGGGLLPNNTDVALKWIALISLAIVAGAAFFLLAVVRPAASFLEDADYHRAIDAAERWVINLAHVLLPLSFITSAVLILLTVNRFQTSTTLWEYLTTLRTGRYRGFELILLAVALAGADLLYLGRTKRLRNIGLATLLGASAGAMLMYSLVSHAAVGKGQFWAVGSDFVHLVASSTWLGALVMLPTLIRWLRWQFDDDTQRFLYLANAADRFSIVAGISVIAILATGTFNGLTQIPNPDAMVHTTYGKVLLAKLALLAPLLAIAGVNAFVLKPRLVSVIDGLYQRGGSGSEDAQSGWSRQLASLQRLLPITAAIEAALVIAVFASVAVLSQAATAKGEVAQQQASQTKATKFDQAATQGDLKLTLDVTPNRVGVNQYDLTIQNADGTPSTTVTEARLRFNYDDVPGAVGPSELILIRFSPGDYRGAGAYFSQPGNWRTDVTVKRSDADDATHAFVLPVGKAAASTTANQGGNFDLPFTVFNWNEVAGAMLALAGAAIILYREQLRWLRQPGYRIGVAIATALMLSGAVLAFGVHSHTGQGNQRVGNPVPPTADSVAAGKTLFQNNCIVCHGIDGRGDGPSAASLSPSPTDFRQHTPLHTDPQFFSFVANGYPGSAMPAFRKAFSDTDIWNIVNFLRAAFSDAPTQ